MALKLYLQLSSFEIRGIMTQPKYDNAGSVCAFLCNSVPTISKAQDTDLTRPPNNWIIKCFLCHYYLGINYIFMYVLLATDPDIVISYKMAVFVPIFLIKFSVHTHNATYTPKTFGFHVRNRHCQGMLNESRG